MACVKYQYARRQKKNKKKKQKKTQQTYIQKRFDISVLTTSTDR